MPEQFDQQAEKDDFEKPDFNQALLAEKEALNNQLLGLAGVEVPDFGKDVEQGEFAEMLDNLREVAAKDKLTYLYNRRALFERGVDYFSSVETSQEGERSLSVMSMDIDYFKVYNEISHTFGDIALQKVGKVLLETTSETEGLGVRLGGEEIFLVVEKQLTTEEVTEAANKIKEQIQQTMNELFVFADENAGKEKGSTKSFLEGRILTEERSRLGFNKEMATKENYKKSVEMAKEYIAVPDDYEPADFALLLRKEIANGNKELQAAYDALEFEVGTITIGVAQIEFDESRAINKEDLSDIQMMAAGLNLENVDLAGKSYPEVYTELQKQAEKNPEKKEKIDFIVKRIKQKRFGKVVDRANVIAEEQKVKNRNSVRVDVIKVEEVDNQNDGVIEPAIAQNYQQTRAALEARQQSEEVLPLDNFTRAFDEMAAKDPDDPDLPILHEALEVIQKDRYYDPLTLAKNYDYLVNVVPEEIELVRENNGDFSIVSFDMDNLKAINEVGGHKLGDVVLMMVSEKMQVGLAELAKKETPRQIRKLAKLIEQQMVRPQVIRATGGEEFIMTLPGLNSDESREVFGYIQEQVSTSIKEVLNQEIGKDEEIKAYLEKMGRSGDELDKFGTLTAGIVSMRELEKSGVDLMVEDKVNAGLMRQIADTVGERLKNESLPDGTTGRGHVWEYETYQMIKKLDERIEALEIQAAESEQVELENEKLKQQLQEAREALRFEKEGKQINKLRKKIGAIE